MPRGRSSLTTRRHSAFAYLWSQAGQGGAPAAGLGSLRLTPFVLPRSSFRALFTGRVGMVVPPSTSHETGPRRAFLAPGRGLFAAQTPGREGAPARPPAEHAWCINGERNTH